MTNEFIDPSIALPAVPAIEFLIGNSFTTGIVVRVDGGARLGSPQ
ncbi:hypothetical protein [Nocardia testacea]|nr:hypothetical protein [Nocardia testacea]